MDHLVENHFGSEDHHSLDPDDQDGDEPQVTFDNLLQEIKYHRNRSFKSVTSEDFVVVSCITIWTDLFVRTFINSNDNDDTSTHDDLLMFVRKIPVKGSKYIAKYTTNLDIYRKESKKLPIGNVDIDWEETLYLNVILHLFDYHLTIGVVSQTSCNHMQILRKTTQKLYASPSFRNMSSKKAEAETISYPNIYFSVDNFESVLSDLCIRDSDMICIELVATQKSSQKRIVIFSGSIDYDPIKQFADTRSKQVSRIRTTFSKSSVYDKASYVKIKSPMGQGMAEMAVLKAPGSACPTPTGSDFDILSRFEDLTQLEVMYDDDQKRRKKRRRWFMLRWMFRLSFFRRFHSHISCLKSSSSSISSSCDSTTGPKQDKHEMRQFLNRRKSDSTSNLNKGWKGHETTTQLNIHNRTRSASEGLDSMGLHNSNGINHEIQAVDLKTEMTQGSSEKKYWSLPGFSQTYHDWKQEKRTRCQPVFVAVTYITLKYYDIIETFIESDTHMPLLTF